MAGARGTDRAADGEPVSSIATLLGLGVFILVILDRALYLLPIEVQSSVSLRSLLSAATYVVVFSGLLFGWRLGFPRWSYPYLGFAFLGLISLSLPGRTPLGLPRWAPFAVAGVVLLLSTRSTWPLASLGRGIRRDFTRLSFALYSLEVTYISLAFDEAGMVSEATGQLLLALVLAVGAYAYMRSTGVAKRFASLMTAITAFWLFAHLGSALFWSSYNQLELDLWSVILTMLVPLAVGLAPVAVPAFLGLKVSRPGAAA